MRTIAKFGSDDVAFILVDGYSILGVSTEIEEEKEAITEDTTPLGTAWKTHGAPGLQRASFSQSGFYDDATGSSNEALVSQYGTTRVVCYGVEGNTIGQSFTGFSGALQGTYTREIAVEEFHKASASFDGAGRFDEGKILANHTARSGDGNTEASSVDNSASSANGGYGYLQVSSLTLGGYTNVTLEIEDSSDDTTFANLATFTATTSAPGSEVVTISGTINQYTAAKWAWNGTGSSESVTAMVGLVRS